jgi:hypothetical protein
MQTKPEKFEGYAEQCLLRANAANDRALKALFLDLAAEWRNLANLAQTLSLEKREREKFYQARRLPE